MRLELAGAPDIPRITGADLKHAVAALPKRRPDLLALQAGYNSQEADVRKEILKQFPSINIGLTRASDTSGVRTVGLGISISLPLFNGNRGGIAIARATRAELRQAYQARLDKAAGQADRVYHESDLLEHQLQQVKQRIPELERVATQAERGLKAGDIDAGTYIAVRTQLLNKRAEAIQLDNSLGSHGSPFRLCSHCLLCPFKMISTHSVGLPAFLARRGSKPNGAVICKSRNTTRGADRPTRRALLWCPAAALRRLTRTRPLPARHALPRNTTGALNASISS